jgi:CheY-like chemotaxis protein
MQADEKLPGAGRTILVVDDVPDIRSTVEQALSEAGYRVLTAAGGLEAEQILTAEKPDLVLIDLLMPEMDGFEVIGDLRRSRPGLPVVAMTGGARMTAASYLKIARSLGAKGILEKPFSKDQLLLSVGLALP